MEHEVFVPVAARSLRKALADPARVAQAIPGLQQDAGPAAASGRLKVRVGGTSITYRGVLRFVPHEDGSYAVEGEGAETRGNGTVELVLVLRLAPVAGGTNLVFDGTVTGGGRFAELDRAAAETAGRRMLRRFAEELAESGAPDGSGAVDSGEADGADGSGESAEQEPAASRADHEAVTPPREGVTEETAAEGSAAGPDKTSGSPKDEDTRPSATAGEEPPSQAGAAEETAGTPAGAGGGAEFGGEPPAEAAHARRTMIGRSAEEVDHAPPRGRYAPVPAPSNLSATATLRWAAPAAAVALASAIVISRALRRRR